MPPPATAIEPLSEADTRAKLIDPALHARGWHEDMIRREETAGAIEIIGGKARRRARGHVDYTLRIKVAADAQPVAVALIEAKKNTLPPGHGLDQGKAYAHSRRLNVPFVFSSNGHQFVEYDNFSGQTAAPRPLSEFPTAAALQRRYEQGMGFALDDEAAKPLLTPYHNGEGARRYYQDAAIRAVLEKIARCEREDEPKRALLSNVTSAVYYVPELTWILFLRVLDEIEEGDAANAEAVGQPFKPTVAAPYRWRDWAAPGGAKRKAVAEDGNAGDFFAFVNGELLPHLKGLGAASGASVRRKVVSEIMRNVERVRIDTERNLLDVLDRVDELSHTSIDNTQMFGLSRVYEGLLLKMGEKNNDGGQFFTPREVIRAMVRVIDPQNNLWCVVSLPGGVFTQAGAGVKTNLLFFTRGEPTRHIWYYDLSDVKVTKRKPLTLAHFQDFFECLPERTDSELSWIWTSANAKRPNRPGRCTATPGKKGSKPNAGRSGSPNGNVGRASSATSRRSRRRTSRPGP